MITARGLFEPLCSEALLLAAANASGRGKRRSPEVAWFLFRRETEVRRLALALREGSWTPQGFDLMFIRDPKRRAISRAPFADRVVHTALVALLEPVFLRSALPNDTACRVGFGTGRAVLAVQRELGRHRFGLHLDIRAYFPSLDPTMVLRLVANRVRDADFLSVLERVLISGAGLLDRPAVRAWLGLEVGWPAPGFGLPVGAHTSQFLATHVVLLELDHFIKRVLKVPGYVRFVDDLLLFGDHRADLRTWRAAIADWLGRERGLRLKHPDAPVLSCAGHLDALGYRLRRGSAEPLPRATRRFRARMYTAVLTRTLDRARFQSSVAATVQHLLR